MREYSTSSCQWSGISIRFATILDMVVLLTQYPCDPNMYKQTPSQAQLERKLETRQQRELRFPNVLLTNSHSRSIALHS